jgi:O-methyltransferase
MLRSTARRLRRIIRKGARARRLIETLSDVEPEFWPLYDACRHATLTSAERLYALYKAVEYVSRENIPGDLVECGVWRGGSVMMMALALQRFAAVGRRLCCFDTFEAMTEPGPQDVRHDGARAADVYSAVLARGELPPWAAAGLDLVRTNIAGTGYPAELVAYCKGKVEQTLPAAAPQQIALLRLDTDWYESTKHELAHLYPRLAPGGVLIIDDYGFWRGARQATDEYFSETQEPMLLSRIDASGRIGVKIA